MAEQRAVGLVPVSVATTVDATIERLAHGGDGVARVDGLVVFVPWTAPGDRVRIEIVERHASYARGRVESVLERSVCRTEPECPVFGRCGGCQLQHVTHPEQISAKTNAVIDAIDRLGPGLGDTEVEFASGADTWAYRDRCLLAWERDGNGVSVGYHVARDAVEIVDTNRCPILAGALEILIPGLRTTLEEALGDGVELPVTGRVGLRRIPSHEPDAGIFTSDATVSRTIAQRVESGVGLPCTWGAVSGSGATRLSRDAPRLERWFEYLDLELRAGFDTFLQADLEAAASMYDTVLDLLELEGGESVIDAYAGIGVNACRMAKLGARVTAIEAHEGAASDLRASAARLEAVHPVHVLQITADRMEWSRPRPGAIVLNPPRGGCPASVLTGIDKSGAETIVYVSCDPATLARDLGRLATGWGFDVVRVFDLFPQTSHVETVVRLRRSS